MHDLDPRKRIVVALDVNSLEQASSIVGQLGVFVSEYKVGLELLHACGTPQVLQHFTRLNKRVFVDAKLHDIPNTVGAATNVITQYDCVSGVTVYAENIDSLFAAMDHRHSAEICAVTVLTSYNDTECELTYGAQPSTKVLQFARNAQLVGAQVVICSPCELGLLTNRRELNRMRFDTPGVRPEWAQANDQKRVATPTQAIRAGARRLIIGRPITNPPTGMTRIEAAERIFNEVSAAASDV